MGTDDPLANRAPRARCPQHALLLDDAGRCHRCDAQGGEVAGHRVLLLVLGALTGVVMLGVCVGLVLRVASAASAITFSSNAPPPRTDSNVRIVVVGAEWCAACKSARSWLSDRGYAYEYRDIDDKATTLFVRDEVKVPPGQVRIPLIGIDGQYTEGFDVGRLARRLEIAEEHHAHDGGLPGL